MVTAFRSWQSLSRDCVVRGLRSDIHIDAWEQSSRFLIVQLYWFPLGSFSRSWPFLPLPSCFDLTHSCSLPIIVSHLHHSVTNGVSLLLKHTLSSSLFNLDYDLGPISWLGSNWRIGPHRRQTWCLFSSLNVGAISRLDFRASENDSWHLSLIKQVLFVICFLIEDILVQRGGLAEPSRMLLAARRVKHHLRAHCALIIFWWVSDLRFFFLPCRIGIRCVVFLWRPWFDPAARTRCLFLRQRFAAENCLFLAIGLFALWSIFMSRLVDNWRVSTVP